MNYVRGYRKYTYLFKMTYIKFTYQIFDQEITLAKASRRRILVVEGLRSFGALAVAKARFLKERECSQIYCQQLCFQFLPTNVREPVKNYLAEFFR